MVMAAMPANPDHRIQHALIIDLIGWTKCVAVFRHLIIPLEVSIWRAIGMISATIGHNLSIQSHWLQRSGGGSFGLSLTAKQTPRTDPLRSFRHLCAEQIL